MRKISFRAEIDGTQAEKQLDQLNRKIRQTEEQLSKAGDKRDGIAERLEQAKNAADEARTRLAESRREYSKVNADLFGARQMGNPTAALAGRRTELYNAMMQQESNIRGAERSVARLTAEYGRANARCSDINRTLERQQATAGDLENKLAGAYSGQRIKAAIAGLKDKIHGLFSRTLSKSVGTFTAGLKTGLRTILRYAIGIRSLFALVRKLRGAVTGGVNNLVKNDARLNASMSQIKSGLSTVKNALGAAFAPIITAVAPIISQFCTMLTNAANAVAKFFATITGQSSYKKAIQVQEDYAASLAGTGGAAKEAAKYLSGLDEIQTYTENSGGGGGSAASANAFAEDAVDGAGSWAAQVKKAISDGDWKGAGSLLAEKMNGLFERFDGSKAAKKLSTAVKNGLEFATAFISDTDWAGLGKQIGDFVANIDYIGIIADVGRTIVAVFKGLLEFVGGFASAIWEKLAPVGDTIKKWWTEKIAPWFTAERWRKLATDAISALESKITPKVDAVKGWYDSKIAPWFTAEKWRKLATDAIGALENKIKPTVDPIKSWWTSKISPWFTVAKWRQLATDAIGALESKLKPTIDPIRSWWTNSIAPWFTATKWRQLANDAIGALKNNFTIGNFSPISTWWSNYVAPWFTWAKWRSLATDAMSALKNGLGLGSFSPISTWWSNYVAPWFTWAKWRQLGLDAISAIKNGLNSLSLPKFHIDWGTAYKSFRVLGKTISMNIPWPDLSFYARGGIVDGATYIGNGRVAGEAGKEAIIPLEQHTEWIKMVADGLADILVSRLADFILHTPLPAVATGSLIPPRLTVDLPGLDDLRSDLADIKAALSGAGRGGNYAFIAQLNRRTLFEEVIDEAKLRSRSTGVNPFLI